MKIAHICLSSTYIDSWGYQENLLPVYLSKLGTENIIISSLNDYPPFLSLSQKQTIKKKGIHYLDKTIEVFRIKVIRLTSSWCIPFGLLKSLKQIQPDVIFHHGITPSSLPICLCYKKKNPSTILLTDNHADQYNISQNKIWRFLYYRCLLRHTAKRSIKKTSKFYGVSIGRCLFLKNFLKIPASKITLLPIGADEDLAKQLDSKSKLRLKYGFNENDKIIISGGKIDPTKGTDALIDSITYINANHFNIKLLLFGEIRDPHIHKNIDHNPNIIFYGWCDRIKTLELLKLADIACWPIHHTTLIEDAISVCTPLLLKKTKTTEHLINGNGIWINHSLTNSILTYFSDPIAQQNIKQECVAVLSKLSYNAIAQKVIYDINSIQNENSTN